MPSRPKLAEVCAASARQGWPPAPPTPPPRGSERVRPGPAGPRPGHSSGVTLAVPRGVLIGEPFDLLERFDQAADLPELDRDPSPPTGHVSVGVAPILEFVERLALAGSPRRLRRRAPRVRSLPLRIDSR